MRLDELDKEIKKGAKAISEFYGNLGSDTSLDDAVYEFLEWFDLAQHMRKFSWRRMAAALHAAGAGRENGQPFTDGHLSGVVWRQRKIAEANERPPKPPAQLWELSPADTKLGQSTSRRSAPERRDNRRGQRLNTTLPDAIDDLETRAIKSPGGVAVPAKSSSSKPSRPRKEFSDKKLESSHAEKNLAFMKNAARLRRP